MAGNDARIPNRPVAIAPRPANDEVASRDAMPYTCQTCARRKVKCDKAAPVCSTCRRGRFECSYQAPRPRKRKLSGEILDKLARYEHILEQHGLLDPEPPTSSSSTVISQPPPLQLQPISLQWNQPGSPNSGKFLVGHGKSRYLDSNLWHTLQDDGMQRLSDGEDEDEDDGQGVPSVTWGFEDPLTGAFLGAQQGLFHFHPTHEEAMVLWATHIENVEPLCKILHIPSISELVDMASRQPETMSNTDECMLFSIYHFAVYSMTEAECATTFEQPRDALLQKYHFAARQALVNASFLKTTKLSVLQALTLFLLACRFNYDSHTFWILTGVAVRIAQRMGLHRDGETLGLPPFEVQMRRRLFYQLLPLDAVASQMSGTRIGIVPDTWDTKQPLNVNDDQIWPGMVETPEEQKGATHMIFCLSRSCVGKYFARTGKYANGSEFKDYHEAELVISEAESEVEEKYIRYCDVINPLHFLTVGMARAGITAMRLRLGIPKVQNGTATDAEKREIFQCAQKTLDTDAAVYANEGLRKYRWHVRPFFLWGTWDSLIFVLTSLWKRSELLSPSEIDSAWNKIEKIYYNHSELLEGRRALYVAFGRLTLKAWDSYQRSASFPEPAFIVNLRAHDGQRRAKTRETNTEASGLKTDTMSSSGPSPLSDANTLSTDIYSNMDMDSEFSINAADWMFWDQLIRDFQTEDGEK